jgi:hypothetical protein
MSESESKLDVLVHVRNSVVDWSLSLLLVWTTYHRLLQCQRLALNATDDKALTAVTVTVTG